MQESNNHRQSQPEWAQPMPNVVLPHSPRAEQDGTSVKYEWMISQLVKAQIYPNVDAVMRSAIQSLFLLRPEQKLRMVASAYLSGEISLGKAAELMGVCSEEMKDIFRQSGVKLHLGPRTVEELEEEQRSFEST